MTRHLVAPVEAARCAVRRNRTLPAIVICSFVSLWLGVALAQAQESACYKSGIAVNQHRIGQPFLESAEEGHFVLSVVDRSEIEARSFLNSVVQLVDPHSADQHSVGRVLIPTESRGPEYASLAALALAPSSLVLKAVSGESAGHAKAGSAASANKTLVYQLGALNFVINALPDSFSVSSAAAAQQIRYTRAMAAAPKQAAPTRYALLAG